MKNQTLFLSVAIHFCLATTFIGSPIPFLEKPSEEVISTRRVDEIEVNSSRALEYRTPTPIQHSVRYSISSNRNRLTPVSIIEDGLIEDELLGIECAHHNSGEYSPLASAILQDNQERFSSIDPSSLRAASVVTPILVVPLVPSFERNMASPIRVMHPVNYLKDLRNRLFPNDGSSLNEDQIMEQEIAVNKAAYAEGISQKELRVLRAQETYNFLLLDFQGAQQSVIRNLVRLHDLTKGVAEIREFPSQVWDDYWVTVEIQKETGEAFREAQEELRAALNAWEEGRIISAVAVAINEEENPSL